MQKGDKEVNKRVRYVVGLSKSIPWYVKKYKELGIDPRQIETPEELLNAYKKGLCTTPQNLSELTVENSVFKQFFLTSGMGGKPKVVAMTSDDVKRDIRQCRKAYETFIESGDIVLNCFPSSPAISGSASIAGLLPFSVKMFHAPVQTLRDVELFLMYHNMFKPNVVFGLTTSIYRLPFLLTDKIPPIKLGIRKIMVSAEPSSTERRKTIGEEFEADVYDWYASSENCMIAYEEDAFSNKYKVTLPDTLMFLVKERDSVSKDEVGDALLTNLYEVGEKPHMILLNYRIGDYVKCLEKLDDGVVTLISDIRRWSAYLAGAKLDPTELEKIIEDLKAETDVKWTGEYIVINYYDEERRAVAEIRMEVAQKLTQQEQEEVKQKIREKIFEANIPVRTMVEEAKDAKLSIEITNSRELYKGYEQYIKPGKPKRLLTLPNI